MTEDDGFVFPPPPDRVRLLCPYGGFQQQLEDVLQLLSRLMLGILVTVLYLQGNQRTPSLRQQQAFSTQRSTPPQALAA